MREFPSVCLYCYYTRTCRQQVDRVTFWNELYRHTKIHCWHYHKLMIYDELIKLGILCKFCSKLEILCNKSLFMLFEYMYFWYLYVFIPNRKLCMFRIFEKTAVSTKERLNVNQLQSILVLSRKSPSQVACIFRKPIVSALQTWVHSLGWMFKFWFVGPLKKYTYF